MQHLLGLALLALRQVVQHVGRLVHPAALVTCLPVDLAQRLAEPGAGAATAEVVEGHVASEPCVEREQADVELLGQAIEIDPQYVLAYSGLADSYILLVSYGNMTGEQATRLQRRRLTRPCRWTIPSLKSGPPGACC